MKLSLANTAYIVRDTGLPVEGRMKVYLHESDNYANVYTMEGSEYVQAENPQLLHAGLPEASLFTDTGIYDIVIEQYIGVEGAMSVESPDEDFAKIDEFQWGLDFDPEAYVSTRVNTIADLRDVDPSVGAVTVMWYSAPGDCMPRTYWWDGASTNAEDGGYVICSDVSDSGRWILMWGDEILPACVYGVQPGNEANVNLLLNYPAVVGSFGLKTAPCVRFESGSYTAGVDYTTTKELVFDGGADFGTTKFTCPRIRVIGNCTDCIADFVFTRNDAEAHSSWFRSIERFWSCGAKYLYLDTTNYFVDTTITRNITLADKVILGTHRLEATYVNSACLIINRCDIGGKIFTPASDYVRLATDRGDGMFVSTGNWDPGLIAQGHHIQYDNAPELAQFASTERWYAAIDERKGRMGSTMSQTVLDFAGRSCSSVVYTTNWQTVRNLVATGGVYVTGDVGLYNVIGNMSVNATSASVSLRNCTITIPSTPTGLATLSSEDSSVTVSGSVGLDPTDTALYVTGGQWKGIIKMSDAHANAYAMHKAVVFTGVHFPTYFKWRVNFVSMTRCTGQVSLDLLPYANGENNWSYSADVTDNVFTGSSRIWFTMFGNSDNQHTDIAGHVTFNGVRIVFNKFNGSDTYGIKMLRWHPYSLNQFMATDAGYSEYHDNTGACPRVTPGVLSNDGHWTGEHTVSTTSVKWRTYDTTYNVWAPYAIYSDGSINVGRDTSGLVPAPEGAAIALCITGFGSAETNGYYLATGYQNGASLPTGDDTFNENLNNMFILRPCITLGLPAMPQVNSGYTTWLKPNAV